MAATMNGSTQTLDAKADLHFKFLAHVQALPVVTDSLDQLYAFPLGRGAGETIKSVSATAFKFSGPINPLLKRADSLADSGLKNIESRFPLVKAPTSEIKEKTSGAAKTTVDTYVGAIHDKFGGLASKAKQDGQAVGEDAKAQTNGVRHSFQDSIDPIVAPVLDKVEGLLDTYLPKAQAKLNAAKKDAEDGAPAAQEKADHTIRRVYDISTSMFDRSTNAARSSIHYGAEKVNDVAATATGYVQWTVQNPSKVPEAAMSHVQAGTASLRERVDGTVEITKSRAQSLTDLAFQAHGTAVQVYEKEKNAAPKDQPRGLIITTINTALVLTGKTLDHAKVYFQESQASSELSEAANNIKSSTNSATEGLAEPLPSQHSVQDIINHGQEKVHKKAQQATKSIDEILEKQEHN